MFSTVKNKRKETVFYVRHSKLNEPPLPLYFGMLIHNKTRKKGPVNEFAEQGLSISYSRLQEVQNNIAGQLCHQYVTEGVVRPKSLKDGLFTSAAIDNIDSNPSSTTANSAFHGTSISIFRHPKEDYPDEPFILDININEGYFHRFRQMLRNQRQKTTPPCNTCHFNVYWRQKSDRRS